MSCSLVNLRDTALTRHFARKFSFHLGKPPVRPARFDGFRFGFLSYWAE